MGYCLITFFHIVEIYTSTIRWSKFEEMVSCFCIGHWLLLTDASHPRFQIFRSGIWSWVNENLRYIFRSRVKVVGDNFWSQSHCPLVWRVSGSRSAGQDHQHNREDNDTGQRWSWSEIHQRCVQSEDLRVLSDAGERFCIQFCKQVRLISHVR